MLSVTILPPMVLAATTCQQCRQVAPLSIIKERLSVLLELRDAFGSRIYIKNKTGYLEVTEVIGGSIADLLEAHITDSKTIPDKWVMVRTTEFAPYRRKVDRCSGERLFFETFNPATRVTRAIVADFDGGAGHSEPLPNPLASACEYVRRWRAVGAHPLLLRSNSGAGYHVYILLESVQNVDLLRGVAEALLPDEERNVVEINPKILSTGSSVASRLSIPWFVYSKPGCNEFVDPDSMAIASLPTLQYLPDEVIRPLVEAMGHTEILSNHPSYPSISITRKGQNSGFASSDFNWRQWKQAVASSSALQDYVYGRYMILHVQPKRGWQAIQDPWRPDKSLGEAKGGRAAFNAETGYYRCLGANTQVQKASIFHMMIRLGLAVNWQQVFELAEMVTRIPRPRKTRSVTSRVTPTIKETAPPEGMLLDKARKELRSVLHATCLNAVPDEIHVIAAGTGTGKTTAIVDAIKTKELFQPHKKGQSGHTLILVSSNAMVDEIIDMFCGDASDVPDYVGRYEARNEENCYYYAQSVHLGHRRHCIVESLCRTCKEERLKTAQKENPSLTSFDISDCKYIQHLESLNSKSVVVGSHQSFLHSASAIRNSKFDTVVIDEDARSALIDNIKIQKNDVEQWLTRAQEHLAGKDLEIVWRFLKLLRCILNIDCCNVNVMNATEMKMCSQGQPLIPYLQAIENDTDTILANMGNFVQRETSPHKHTTVIPADSVNKEEILVDDPEYPLKAITILAKLLADESAAGNPAATQIWLQIERKSGKPAPAICVMRPKNDVIKALRERFILILDATASEDLYKSLFGDTLRIHRIDVAMYYTCTFFADSLFSFNSFNPSNGECTYAKREAIAVITKLCERYKKPLVVVPMSIKKTLKACLPDHVELTHWFSGDVRGSNAFADCDALLLLGHPRISDQQHVWLSEALRQNAALESGEQRQNGQDPHARISIELPLPGFVSPDGSGRAVRTSYPAEYLANRLARESYNAIISQTLGRLRLNDPDKGVRPVYLMTGEPTDRLRIDEVTTSHEWLQENASEWLQWNPAPENTSRSATTDAQKRALEQANNGKSIKARDKVIAAVAYLITQNKPVTLNAVVKHTGVSKQTAQKYTTDIATMVKAERCISNGTHGDA